MEGEELEALAGAFDEIDPDTGDQGDASTGKTDSDDVEIVIDDPKTDAADEEVVLVDEEGNRVNEAGELVDEDGNVIDVDQPKIDASGKVSIPDEAKVVLVIDGKEVEHSFGDIRANAQKWAGAEKRFQEAATIQKDAEAKMAVLPELEQKLGQVLQFYVQQAQEYVAKEPDWDKLLAENPTEFLRTQHAWNARKAQLQQAQQIHNELAKKQSDAEAASRQVRLVEEQQKLLTAIPEWSDPQKAKEGSSAVLQYIKDAGIPEEMLKEIDHHAVIVIARKALLYDQAIAKQKAIRANGGRAPQQQAAVQPPRKVVRVERPGAGTAVAQPEQRHALKKANAAKVFNQKPSIDALANLFE